MVFEATGKKWISLETLSTRNDLFIYVTYPYCILKHYMEFNDALFLDVMGAILHRSLLYGLIMMSFVF